MNEDPNHPSGADVHITVFLHGLRLEYRAHPTVAILFLRSTDRTWKQYSRVPRPATPAALRTSLPGPELIPLADTAVNLGEPIV